MPSHDESHVHAYVVSRVAREKLSPSTYRKPELTTHQLSVAPTNPRYSGLIDRSGSSVVYHSTVPFMNSSSTKKFVPLTKYRVDNLAFHENL